MAKRALTENREGVAKLSATIPAYVEGYLTTFTTVPRRMNRSNRFIAGRLTATQPSVGG